MTWRQSLRGVLGQDHVNFWLTNRIPRRTVTRLMGSFSKIEFAPVRAASIAAWKLLCDVDLSDARPQRYRSLHQAFVRELREGARPVDPDPAVIVSPCDALVGAFGRVEAGMALQVKGMAYPLAELLGSEDDAAAFEGGWFVTLRLTAGMYHRFHAPADLMVEQVRYIPGDAWNVNPPALARVDRLYCKNERAPIAARLDDGGRIMLVPIAAIMVASLRLPWFDGGHGVREGGPRAVPCTRHFAKGEEMGWFEHGSTIVLLASPEHVPTPGLVSGQRIRMGEPLIRLDKL